MSRPGTGRVAHAAAIAVLAAAAVAGLGCDRSGDGAAIGHNVVLISVDTLRADHLSCYGYARPTSPHIDRFAESATRYRRAYATSPWTVPSHASMFTGKHPREHGAHSVPVNRPVNNVNPLPDAHQTLAEALAAEGYRTGAFVANYAFLSERWQLDQGFETYVVDKGYGDQLNERVFAWLDDQPDDQPFFLFVNYTDTHWPYNVARARGFPVRPVTAELRNRLLAELYAEVLPADGPLPAARLRMLVDLYDTAIANLDANLGALLTRLEQDGRMGDTVIVITSDHGEYFGEHHLLEHSKDVYQAALAVPLLVRRPGQLTGEVSDTVVSSVDVPRLILAAAGGDLERRLAPLFPYAPGEHPLVAENYYTRLKDLFHPAYGHRFNRVRTVLFEPPYKLIRSSDGAHELYDLEADPDEAENLYAARPEVAARLSGTLRAFEAGTTSVAAAAEAPRLTEQERERLRSLGYVP